MGRPSLKEERNKQILDAFFSCVARYGIDGSSLEMIAKESGLQRSLVRHFAGNRDDLIHRLSDKVINDTLAQWQQVRSFLPEKKRVQPLLGFLFAQETESSSDLVMVIESLVAVSGRYPVIQKQFQVWLNNFISDMQEELKQEYPHASAANCKAAAFGVISIYFNLDSLSALNMNNVLREDAILAAQRLVGTLKLDKEKEV